MPDAPKETVLDAVNAALGTPNENQPDSPETETADSDAADAERDAGEAESDSADAGDSEATDSESGDGAGEDSGDEDPDRGESKSEAAAKRDEPGKPKEPSKEPDALNDPVPRDLKKETRDRIHSLINSTREAQAKTAEVENNYNIFLQGLQGAGVTPAQYSETLQWLGLFNQGMNGNAEAGEKALEVLVAATERLATFLGKPAALGDPLANHPDLIQAVQQKQVPIEFARELARNRNQAKFRGEITTGARNEQQQREVQAREEQAARNGLTQFEQQMRQADPQYEAKKALLVPQLKAVMKNVPFNRWLETFKAAYAQVKVPAPPSRVPANQPLRANRLPAGSAPGKKPTALDVVNAALDEFAGR